MMQGRCPHRSVQQFTEMCLDCGRNIHETDAEYLRHLEEEVDRRAQQQQVAENSTRIIDLERQLGIRHPGNQD